jgi:raffinose/stachyose/melibiose transport system substrate-binding protein
MTRHLRKLGILILLVAVLAACAPAAPQVVEKVVTKEVEKVVTQVVKETVIVEVEGTPQVVEKEVVVTATPAPEQVEEVSLEVWYTTGNPVEIALMEDLSARFEEAHPGVTVNFSPYGFDDLRKNFKLALDTQTGPDVTYLGPGSGLSEGGDNGLLLDLTPYVKQRGWDQKFDMDMNLAYNPWPGQVYGMAYDLVTIGAYYNKDIFQELGLEQPATWEDLQAVITTLKDNGYTPFATAGMDAWPLDHYFYALAHLTTPYEEIEKVWRVQPDGDYTHPGFVEAMTILKDWIDQGYFNEDFMAIGNADAVDLFSTGQTAMFIAGTWNTSSILQNADFEPGFFAAPGPHADLEWRAVTTPNNFWVVSEWTEQPDVAVDFIDYMLSEEVAVAKWEAGDIPMFKFASVPEATSPLQLEIYNATQVTKGGQYLAQYSHDVMAVQGDVEALMVAGELTPEDAQATVQEAYQQHLAELE